MTTLAAQYAARAAEWKRTATSDQRIDEAGRPHTPLLHVDRDVESRAVANVEDDGGLYVRARFWTPAEALALRDFIGANYEEPGERLLSCDPRLLLLRDAAEFVNLVAEGVLPFGVETAGRAQHILDNIKAMLMDREVPSPLPHMGVPISREDHDRISRDGP